MSLNIKCEETHRLAQQLSQMTGESMTQIVRDALRDRLDRERKERDVDKRVAEIMAFVRTLGPAGDAHSLDHGEMFYDENGLPK